MGDQAAFLSAGGYHHHIGLNTWESKGGSPPPPGTTGLYHVAIRYPSRAALADALKRLVDSGRPDHGRLRPRRQRGDLPATTPTATGSSSTATAREEEWPRPPDGKGVAMVSEPLDLQALLAEADG